MNLDFILRFQDKMSIALSKIESIKTKIEMSRQKTTQAPAEVKINRAEAEQIYTEYVDAVLNLNAENLMLENEIADVRANREPKLVKLTEAKEQLFNKLHLFASQNPDLFNKSRSIQFVNGKLGYRKSCSLELKNEKATWEKALDKVRELFPKLGLIRVKEELDKTAIKKRFENDVKFAKELAKAGLIVESKESFFVEPAKEKPISSSESTFISSLLS